MTDSYPWCSAKACPRPATETISGWLISPDLVLTKVPVCVWHRQLFERGAWPVPPPVIGHDPGDEDPVSR